MTLLHTLMYYWVSKQPIIQQAHFTVAVFHKDVLLIAWEYFYWRSQRQTKDAFALSFLSYYSWYSCYTAPSQFDLRDCGPCEIAPSRIRPSHCGWTFVFIGRMRAAVMVNNYGLRIQQSVRKLNAVRTSKYLLERAGPWCVTSSVRRELISEGSSQ